MTRRFLATAIAVVVAFGSTLKLAACELDCSHEAGPSVEHRGTGAQESPSATADAESHSCHQEAASHTADVSVRGLQECTHSGPAGPPFSIKHDVVSLRAAILVSTERAVFDAVRLVACQPLIESRERGSSAPLSLRI
jgi:hypothetical protein